VEINDDSGEYLFIHDMAKITNNLYVLYAAGYNDKNIIVEFDDKGRIRWKKHDNDNFYVLHKIVPLKKGKFLIIKGGDDKSVIYEYNVKGNIVKEKNFSYTIGDVLPTDDGGFITITPYLVLRKYDKNMNEELVSYTIKRKDIFYNYGSLYYDSIKIGKNYFIFITNAQHNYIINCISNVI